MCKERCKEGFGTHRCGAPNRAQNLPTPSVARPHTMQVAGIESAGAQGIHCRARTHLKNDDSSSSEPWQKMKARSTKGCTQNTPSPQVHAHYVSETMDIRTTCIAKGFKTSAQESVDGIADAFIQLGGTHGSRSPSTLVPFPEFLRESSHATKNFCCISTCPLRSELAGRCASNILRTSVGEKRV